MPLLKRKVSQPKFKFELGAQVEDKITGYKGMITGRTEWLFGCRRYSIQSKEMKDGKPVDAWGCDEDALQLKRQVKKVQITKRRAGPSGGEPSRAQTSVSRR